MTEIVFEENVLPVQAVIINRPERKQAHHKMVDAMVALTYSGFWVWIGQSSLTAMLWYLDLILSRNHVIVLGGLPAVPAAVSHYAVIGAMLCLSLLLWARMQQWRFSNNERRRQPVSMENRRIADWFQVDEQERRRWLGRPILRIAFDDQNRIACVSGA